jgi:hypothetical protein
VKQLKEDIASLELGMEDLIKSKLEENEKILRRELKNVTLESQKRLSGIAILSLYLTAYISPECDRLCIVFSASFPSAAIVFSTSFLFAVFFPRPLCCAVNQSLRTKVSQLEASVVECEDKVKASDAALQSFKVGGHLISIVT